MPTIQNTGIQNITIHCILQPTVKVLIIFIATQNTNNTTNTKIQTMQQNKQYNIQIIPHHKITNTETLSILRQNTYTKQCKICQNNIKYTEKRSRIYTITEQLYNIKMHTQISTIYQ